MAHPCQACPSWKWRRLPPGTPQRGTSHSPRSAEKFPGPHVADSEQAGWPGTLNVCSAGPKWTPRLTGAGRRGKGPNDGAGVSAAHTASPECGTCGPRQENQDAVAGEAGIGLVLGQTHIPGACHRDRAGGWGETDTQADRSQALTQQEGTSVILRSDFLSNQERLITATCIGLFAMTKSWDAGADRPHAAGPQGWLFGL